MKSLITLMVDQIITKIRYENINIFEFAGHSYINVIMICDSEVVSSYTKLYNSSIRYPAPCLRGGYAPSVTKGGQNSLYATKYHKCTTFETKQMMINEDTKLREDDTINRIIIM